MIITILILSIALVAIAVIGLGINIFFRKNGKFPETGVGHNPEMKKLGLSCAKSEEIKMFQLQKKINPAKSGYPDHLISQSGGCAGCNCSHET